MAPSLAAGTGRVAGCETAPGWSAAALLPHSDRRRAAVWRPIRAAGWIVLFAGHLANARTLAGELGLAWPDQPGPEDLARLYGTLVASGDAEPDLRAIGEYAAAMLDPARALLRLSRSPLRAPPLHYFCDGARTIAASVPRAIHAAGFARETDGLRLADNAWFNYASTAPHWYKGMARVPLGAVVEIDPGNVRTRRYYDIQSLPKVRLPRAEDYVERARELLDEGVAAALRGFSRPGVLLSGGLDSPQVAESALRHLPLERDLPSFTFTVESGWDGVVPAGLFGDERTPVEAFAALHPRIKPHFFDNLGKGFDHGLAEMFHFAGIAPVNLSNFSVYHDPWRAARAMGCDVILLSEWGNETFSHSGEWGFVEYFLKLRWGELFKALKTLPDDPRPMWRRLVGKSLLPLLPAGLWRWQRRMRGEDRYIALASPLRSDFAANHALDERSRTGGSVLLARPARNRREALRVLAQTSEDEGNDIWQGFEQWHGLPQRDPTAYRPLVEFCLGLPTEVFLRGGQQRWLARQMARGIMPEEQRLNPREGRHHADWLAKLTPRVAELRAELERLEQVPELAEQFDFPRLKAALENWPERTPDDPIERMTREVTLTRGIAMARFANFLEGRNA